MSIASATLPEWLAPRRADDPAAAGSPLRRSLETLVVVLVGVLLAVATVDDLHRQVGLNERFAVDKRTWRSYTHRNVKLLGITPAIRGNLDIVCGPPIVGDTSRLCLMLGGPAHVHERQLLGGFRLAFMRPNRYIYRYGCFGVAASRSLCGVSGPT